MDKLRIGIIGAGTLAERAKEKALRFNIAEVYDDYEKMLHTGDIDAVSIATVNNTHAPITIAALKAGKNVLCEKPPATNCREALEMQRAAEKYGKLLMFGFVKRFSPNVQVVKEFIDGGEMGEIYFAKTGYLRRCGNPGGWFSNQSVSGGGPLIDLGVHIIDLNMYLMGKPKPVSVFGCTYDKIGSRANIRGISRYRAACNNYGVNDVEDFANAIIKFDNGASLYFETSWVANIKSDTIYSVLLGDKGGIELEPDFCIFSENRDYLIDVKPVLDSYSFDFNKAFNAEINHFIDCILNGTPCICRQKME